ncbi:hypothetical protein [Archangium violaceum]|uniref:Lipoprotein n=1 Tax=Archangium violaceum Cb vi76 TaxID=1406225 RepID=A0A084SF38_9BACT|nr:hypothetical protein [Archangium violaceum]KFA87073.1 hypothetical protein Q664_50265 [Archangium violaceum Cb vi76]
MFKGSGGLAAALLVTAGCKQPGRQQRQEQVARTRQRNAQVQGNQRLQQLVTGQVVSASPDARGGGRGGGPSGS